MENVVLVRYGEIGLKGRIGRLLKVALGPAPAASLRPGSGAAVERVRPPVVDPAGREAPEAHRPLRSVFGVVSVSPAPRLPLDMEPILSGCEALVAQALARAQRPVTTFKIAARRSNKAFPLRSPRSTGARRPRVTVLSGRLYVDVRSPDSSGSRRDPGSGSPTFTRKFIGSGGLPVGEQRGSFSFRAASTRPWPVARP